MTERAVTFSARSIRTRYSFQESGRESGLRRKIYFIQLSIATQIGCTVILSRTVQSREQTRVWKATKKKSRQIFKSKLSIFIQWQIYIRDFNHSISLMFSVTSVNRFKLSITHSSNGRSRTSNDWKNLRSLSKLWCETNSRYSILKLSRNNSRATTSTVLSSLQNIKSLNIKNVLKS